MVPPNAPMMMNYYPGQQQQPVFFQQPPMNYVTAQLPQQSYQQQPLSVQQLMTPPVPAAQPPINPTGGQVMMQQQSVENKKPATPIQPVKMSKSLEVDESAAIAQVHTTSIQSTNETSVKIEPAVEAIIPAAEPSDVDQPVTPASPQ